MPPPRARWHHLSAPRPLASTRSPVPVENVVSPSATFKVTGGSFSQTGDDPRTVNWLPPDAFSAPCTSVISA
jgi:hypothetical protein